MAKLFIDLSIPRTRRMVSDPPGMGPAISASAYLETAPRISGVLLDDAT